MDFSKESLMVRRWCQDDGWKKIRIGDREKLSCWRSQKEFEMEIISAPQISKRRFSDLVIVGVVDKKYYVQLYLLVSEVRLYWDYRGMIHNDWCDLYWEEINQMKLFDYNTDGWSDDDVMYGIQREEEASGEWK